MMPSARRPTRATDLRKGTGRDAADASAAPVKSTRGDQDAEGEPRSTGLMNAMVEKGTATSPDAVLLGAVDGDG
jgi:hypothetical protein